MKVESASDRGTHPDFSETERIMAMKRQDHIEERQDVMLGKPVFKGTRLTVEHVLHELGTGMSPDELFDNFPNLKPEHMQPALRYAADLVAMGEAMPVQSSIEHG